MPPEFVSVTPKACKGTTFFAYMQYFVLFPFRLGNYGHLVAPSSQMPLLYSFKHYALPENVMDSYMLVLG